MMTCGLSEIISDAKIIADKLRSQKTKDVNLVVTFLNLHKESRLTVVEFCNRLNFPHTLVNLWKRGRKSTKQIWPELQEIVVPKLSNTELHKLLENAKILSIKIKSLEPIDHPQKIAQFIQLWGQSGLTAQKFCEIIPFSTSLFSFWKRGCTTDNKPWQKLREYLGLRFEPEENKINISPWIKMINEKIYESKISLATLSAKTGISKSGLSRILNGYRISPEKTRQKLITAVDQLRKENLTSRKPL